MTTGTEGVVIEFPKWKSETLVKRTKEWTEDYETLFHHVEGALMSLPIYERIYFNNLCQFNEERFERKPKYFINSCETWIQKEEAEFWLRTQPTRGVLFILSWLMYDDEVRY